MARQYLQYTQPCTVVHGYVIENGEAVYTSFELEGGYYPLEKAGKMARKLYNQSFTADAVTHAGKVYKMKISEFLKNAELAEIKEK